MAHPKAMAISDWVTEDEAIEVKRLAGALSREERSVSISKLATELGLSEEDVRGLVATVRHRQLFGPSRLSSFFIGLWHLFIICVTAVVIYAAFSELRSIARYAQPGLLANGTLWLEIAWVAFVGVYYRHALVRKLKRVFDGYRPASG